MIYPWRCEKCKGVTDVRRSVDDIESPPEKCDHCDSTAFTERLILRPGNCKGYILSDTGLGWPSHGFYNKPYYPEKKK